MNFGSRRTKIILGVLLVLVLVIGFRIYNNIQKEKAKASRTGGAKAMAVVTQHPHRETIIPSMKFSGSLDPQWRAEVGSKVDGRLAKVFVKEGDRVHKGQVLAILEGVDANASLRQAKGAFLDAQTSLRKAEQDLTRYRKLHESGAISEKALDDYVFARDNARAKLETAQGNLESAQSKADDTSIVAPADGVVYKRYYQEGYYAKAATPVFAIADISSLKITVHIPEGNISGIAVGNKANIKLAAYKDKKLQGVITHISPVADLPSHTFAAEISIPNAGGMRAGIFADVALTAEPKENALVIPIQAIVMRDDQKTVFVPDAKGFVQRKVLDIGFMNDKYAEVLSGVDEKELIVVEGHNKLREGSLIKLDEKAGK